MDLVTKIINKKLPVIIISPHPDDAILSCGELLQQLFGKVSCTIITVFTKANGGPHTLSTKQFLKASGERDALSLYKERRKEDEKAQKFLGTKIINLGLEDALFRRKKQKTMWGKFIPELDHIYPTYRWHILNGIAPIDPAIADLKKKLKPFINKKAIIIIPYGIGDHVDHLLTSKVSRELFNNAIFYSDFPYNIRLNNYGKTTGMQVYKLQPDIQRKNKLIQIYKTQFKGLFPDGTVPEHKEVYFVPEKNNLFVIQK
jgi:LmbE family N-acetylglucosaminyl deacetylase